MFKYVPVLRFRDQERLVLRAVTLSQKTLPLIEIVKETPNGNFRGDFQSIHQRELGHLQIPFMVDIPTHYRFGGVNRIIRNFLSPYQVNYAARANKLIELSQINNLIPIVSRNPWGTYPANSIPKEANLLRHHFDRIGFRVFESNFNAIISDIDSIITKRDVLVFEIGTKLHTDASLRPAFNRIKRIKRTKGCTTVIIRSPIPSAITNVGLAHGQPIQGINNNLKDEYTNYHFDAFGDYAGIKADLPSTGGQVSPGLIYYSWHSNQFIGFRGIQKDLDSFIDPIAVSVINSNYWYRYSGNHHHNCPGCRKINAVANRTESRGTQATWKGITLAHYLYTMEEFL